MWFVFPQLAGLRRSETAPVCAIRSQEEARVCFRHPVRDACNHECVASGLANVDRVAVFGEVDALKLRSSLTLFEAARSRALFEDEFARWFGGIRRR